MHCSIIGRRCGLWRDRQFARQRHHHADYRCDHGRARLLELFPSAVVEGDSDIIGRGQKAGCGARLG